MGLAAPQITYIMHALKEKGTSCRSSRYNGGRSEAGYFACTSGNELILAERRSPE